MTERQAERLINAITALRFTVAMEGIAIVLVLFGLILAIKGH